MKVKLNFSLSAAAVMLFVLSMTGYAHPTHSDRLQGMGNTAIENPDAITLSDKDKVSQKTEENIVEENRLPTSETGSPKDSQVSQWLEARATEESLVLEPSAGKPSVEPVPLPMLEEGGGWCDYCGCWMKHGLDPNGTPQSEIGHQNVCVGGSDPRICWSHYYSNCGSS